MLDVDLKMGLETGIIGVYIDVWKQSCWYEL